MSEPTPSRATSGSLGGHDATRRVALDLQRVVRSSVADATEILWMQRRLQRVGVRAKGARTGSWLQRTVEVRVVENGMLGQHRLGSAVPAEIESAVRRALAASRSGNRRATPLMPQPETVPRVEAFDRRLARLSSTEVHDVLNRRCGPDGAAIFEWSDGQVLLVNSEGLELTQRVTSCAVQTRSGKGPGAGFASDAARSLERVDLDALFRRAAARRSGDDHESMGFEDPLSLVLSPEATAELVEMLNHRAFSATAYRQGTSFLREHLGVQVFDQRLQLRDDALDPSGLPFPFDLEGRPKRLTRLVEAGVPRTPTLDSLSALQCGLTATGHGLAPGEGFATNLFMEPGDSSEQDLLASAEGGLWISRLEAVECFDPSRMLIRARARGVRRVVDTRVGAPLPDLLWEDSLLRIFASLTSLGRSTARRLSSDGFLGGISAPAVVVGAAQSLRETATPRSLRLETTP